MRPQVDTGWIEAPASPVLGSEANLQGMAPVIFTQLPLKLIGSSAPDYVTTRKVSIVNKIHKQMETVNTDKYH